MMGVKMEGEIQRSVALILIKYNDYVGARRNLLDAQTSFPGLEYVDDLIKLCEIACRAESEGSEIDWYSLLQTDKTANESDMEFKYTELIRALEPVKNKFPEIQSTLGLIEKTHRVFSIRVYEFDSRRDACSGPCGSVKPLETVNISRKATSQSSFVTKRIVSEVNGDSDDAVNKLGDKEKVAEEIDSESHGVRLGGSMVNDSECENSSSDSDDAVDKLYIGKVKEIIKGNRKKELKWQTEDDMISSLEKDPSLCMRAVCALHRQPITEGKSVTGSLHNSNRRFSCFSKFVALRGNEMAEFLTDHNPQADLKKSVKELEMFMPDGLEDCKTLARFYSNELFTIYQNHEDPFFGSY